MDYVKEDWCNSRGLTAPTQYRKFHEALVATGRPIVLSICEIQEVRAVVIDPHGEEPAGGGRLEP